MHSRLPAQQKISGGFTLIELLIVIAVIFILAAIIFPIAKSATESANRTACTNNLRQIAQMVEAYRQDHTGYPPLPGFVGLHGIPEGGVTSLALTSLGVSPRVFWCPLDAMEARYSNMSPTPQRDDTGSTYEYGYNFYGLVTATDGLPYAISSPEAARYLFDIGQPAWNLDLIDTRTNASGVAFHRPKGLFQGLWNVHAPPDTVVTYCLNHPAEAPRSIPVITIGGAAYIVKPETPRDDLGNALGSAGAYPRQPDTSKRSPGIDWRINKAPYRKGTPDSNDLYGDSAGNEGASRMPIIETFYRSFSAANMAASMGADGAGWYDTGIDCAPGDVIMLRAHARWNYFNDSNANDRTFWTARDSSYASYFTDAGALYFSAAGDPVEVAKNAYPTGLLMVFPGEWSNSTSYRVGDWVRPAGATAGTPYYQCLQAGASGPVPPAWSATSAVTDGTAKWQAGIPSRPHCQLIAKIGVNGTIFAVGANNSIIVPPGVAGSLMLSLNDTLNDYGDNSGWCEIWFGMFRPAP